MATPQGKTIAINKRLRHIPLAPSLVDTRRADQSLPAGTAPAAGCGEILTARHCTLTNFRRKRTKVKSFFVFLVIQAPGTLSIKAYLDGRRGREAARERDRQHILADLTRREFGAGGETQELARGKPGCTGRGGENLASQGENRTPDRR